MSNSDWPAKENVRFSALSDEGKRFSALSDEGKRLYLEYAGRRGGRGLTVMDVMELIDSFRDAANLAQELDVIAAFQRVIGGDDE